MAGTVTTAVTATVSAAVCPPCDEVHCPGRSGCALLGRLCRVQDPVRQMALHPSCPGALMQTLAWAALVTTCQQSADEVTSSGPRLVAGVKDSYEADGSALEARAPLAVLVNHGTASASEVSHTAQ